MVFLKLIKTFYKKHILISHLLMRNSKYFQKIKNQARVFPLTTAFFFPFFFFLFFLSFFSGCTHSIRKLLGQESNSYHSRNLSHCSDNKGSLTHCATREFPYHCFSTSCWSPSQCNKTRKEIKSTQIGQEDIKLSLFTDDMFI